MPLSTRKRVLHILDPEPKGNVGGADLHVVDLACEQKRHGHFEPSVLLLTEAPLIAERLSNGGVETLLGHKIGDRYFKLPFALRSDLDRLSPDILHSHGYDANYLVCWARIILPKLWSRSPLLFTSHGWVDRPSLFIKTSLDLLSHRFADHVIICSPHQYPRARIAAGHSAISFVCNGVPIDRVSLLERQDLDERFGLPSDTRLVGFVGRLSKEKRVDIFIDIAYDLSRRIDNVHFVIAGGGPLEQEIRLKIQQYNLAEHITMTGVMPDIDNLCRYLEVLVVPSNMETTSRVTIEALLWGVPVVASDVGGLKVLIDSDKDGYLCPCGNVSAFVSRVEYLLTHQAEYLEMKERGRDKARRSFGIEMMSKKVSEIYDTVLTR